jgi:hypothetical protein
VHSQKKMPGPDAAGAAAASVSSDSGSDSGSSFLLRPRSEHELAGLLQEALAYAAANGLLMAAPAQAQQSPQQTLYGHAPFALLPDAFPAREYLKARDLAPLFNSLVRVRYVCYVR